MVDRWLERFFSIYSRKSGRMWGVNAMNVMAGQLDPLSLSLVSNCKSLPLDSKVGST